MKLNDLNMKTDLAKVFTISGEQGLFTYVAPAKNGAVVESMITKKRLVAGAHAKMSALNDISIYTMEEEVKLQKVLENLKNELADNDAPAGKTIKPEEYKALFKKVLPDYDEDRFYPSHMKKVCDWYNALKKYATLDFLTEQEREEEAKRELDAKEK